MDSFLMLGIIPGTSFQINFDDWVRGIVILVGLLIAWVIFRNRYKIELVLFFLTLRWHKITAITSQLA